MPGRPKPDTRPTELQLLRPAGFDLVANGHFEPKPRASRAVPASERLVPRYADQKPQGRPRGRPPKVVAEAPADPDPFSQDLTGSALHQGDVELRQGVPDRAREARLRPPNRAVAKPGWQIGPARDRFLALYAERGTMVECCRLAGLSYDAVRNAIDHNTEFAQAFHAAEQAVLEKLEREAMRRAVEGTVQRSRRFWHGELVAEDVRVEYSDNLLMLLLKAKAPERYRDNSLITINQVIKAVEGFDPREVLGLPSAEG